MVGWGGVAWVGEGGRTRGERISREFKSWSSVHGGRRIAGNAWRVRVRTWYLSSGWGRFMSLVIASVSYDIVEGSLCGGEEEAKRIRVRIRASCVLSSYASPTPLGLPITHYFT